ncbi:MAG: hypothetical protein R2838_22860 [Caldilineaceae bacterium]
MPDDYIRKQTLANAGATSRPTSKSTSRLVLNADERRLRDRAAALPRGLHAGGRATADLLKLAAGLAELDVYASLAEVALRCAATCALRVDEGPSGRSPWAGVTPWSS